MPRMNPAHIIAASLSWDAAEVSANRYQPTRYASPAVYVIGDDYMACSKTAPKHSLGRWERHSFQFFAERAGTVLWVAKAA